jgi:protein-L-isoaspartate(D-aspartate) O-methyltransferase
MSVVQEKDALVRSWRSEYHFAPELEQAFMDIPREDFILPQNANRAYADYPLPIICNQTISQPTTVMLMLDFLQVRKHHTILEIGTGSGYNAALLGRLAKTVYSIEFFGPLAQYASLRISRLKLANVYVIEGDGRLGLPNHAPFDRIIITAACDRVPEPLFAQLAPDGILLAPINAAGENVQVMTRFVRTEKGFAKEELGRYSFVPLLGKFGVSQ